MADIYTPIPRQAYALGIPFYMPTSKRDRWAVSFDSNGATLLVAALSVAVTVSFLCLWNLVTFLSVFLGSQRLGGRTWRRYAALVTLWNSNDPWFAFKALLKYTWQCRQGSGSIAAAWADIRYAATVCLVAFVVFGGSIALGIIAPSLVQIGNVAPAVPGVLFYPASPTNYVEFSQNAGLRAPSNLRSLGSVEASEVTLRKKVLIPDAIPLSGPKGPGVQLTYTYSLSGVDMGLRGGPDLAVQVEGSCTTEYSWEGHSNPESQDLDQYYLWGNSSRYVTVDLQNIANGPFADFYYHPLAGDQLYKDSNVSFAIVIHSAHRLSSTAGGDPLYVTEVWNGTSPNSDYRIQRHRPVLSCWEQDKWRYKEHTVASVFDLQGISNIKIPKVLLEVLETTFNAGPMIMRLGLASGASALKSSTTSYEGIIDAGASKTFDDMERLILASYVATRNIFTDTTMFGQPKNYKNVITGPDGQPQEGAGNFVVSSPDIQTFSLTGIVTLAAILLALLIANSLVWVLVHLNDGDRAGEEPGMWAVFRVLSAVHLFRCLYDEQKKVTGADKWDCVKSVPPMPEPPQTDSFSLACCKDLKHNCRGHINIPVAGPATAT